MAENHERPRFGEILVDRGVVTQAQIAEGLREQQSRGGRLGACLLRLGLISEEVRLDALATQLSLRRVDLARMRLSDQAIQSLPLDFVRRYSVLPVKIEHGTLGVATSNPGERRIIEDIRLLSSLEVEECLAPAEAIREKIAECYEITVERMIEDLDPESAPSEESADLHDIEVMASEPTVINLVNLIISTALRERASDIHLVPFEKTLELRYRVDGVLRVMQPPPKHLHAALVSRIKIMANLNIAERFLPQDGHIQIQHGTGASARRVDIRVGTMPTIYGESVVMRLLEKDQRVLSLEELGLDRERAKTLDRLVGAPYGIFLSTGPTGCGKTTTLYSLLNSIYSPERKILTIEDPVEYELPGVGQIPVRPARGFTFATGLRAILRQDPDVIMVGEVRDTETAEIAIRAALTGHLVFSTLHTNDAPGAVTRLVDMGVEPFLIASSLQGILAQRLVRRICTVCKAERALDAQTAARLEALGIDPGPGPFFAGEGCDECRQTGYRGRTGLFELLVMSPGLRELVLAGKTSGDIEARATGEMLTMREDGMRKARAGGTTVEEVLRVAAGESVEE